MVGDAEDCRLNFDVSTRLAAKRADTRPFLFTIFRGGDFLHWSTTTVVRTMGTQGFRLYKKLMRCPEPAEVYAQRTCKTITPFDGDMQYVVLLSTVVTIADTGEMR